MMNRNKILMIYYIISNTIVILLMAFYYILDISKFIYIPFVVAFLLLICWGLFNSFEKDKKNKNLSVVNIFLVVMLFLSILLGK